MDWKIFVMNVLFLMRNFVVSFIVCKVSFVWLKEFCVYVVLILGVLLWRMVLVFYVLKCWWIVVWYLLVVMLFWNVMIFGMGLIGDKFMLIIRLLIGMILVVIWYYDYWVVRNWVNEGMEVRIYFRCSVKI